MTKNVSAIAVALIMTTTAFAGIASAAPFFPTPWTAGGASQGPGPQVQACNVAGASTIGYNGNSAGSSTGYHSYANVPGFSAGDYCMTVPGAAFLTCTQGTVNGAIANFTTTYNANPLPATDGITAARRGLVTETENWALGQTCDGILGTGSDGEYEFGDLTAVLDVRDNGGITDSTPTQGGASTTKGSDVKDCINPKASNHHGANTDIYVLDVVFGSDIEFTVDGDWSRPDWLSSGANDENDNPSPTQCGADGLEPCAFYTGGTGGSVPDIESGRESADAELGALAGQAVANGASLAGLAKTLEYEGGCNPLDFSFDATGGHFAVSNTLPCSPSSLADLSSGFDCDYTAGAAGFITVSINGAIVQVDNSGSATVHTIGTLGWVWTA